MTSHDTIVHNADRTSTEKDKMREFRRPTLCVIDENGLEITQNEDIKKISGSDVDIPGNDVKLLTGYTSRDCNANVTTLETSNLLSPNTCLEKDLDLIELKATTARLKLSTRRQSTVAWQQEYMNASCDPVKPKFDVDKLNQNTDDTLTEERKSRINEALAWLRSELVRKKYPIYIRL